MSDAPNISEHCGNGSCLARVPNNIDDGLCLVPAARVLEETADISPSRWISGSADV